MDKELVVIREELSELKEKQVRILKRMNALEQQLSALEKNSTAEADTPLKKHEVKRGSSHHQKPVSRKSVSKTKETSVQQSPDQTGDQPSSATEALIGGTWLNRIGIIAFILGIAFFIKFAFDQGWITETWRVAIGGMAGVILLFAGERTRKQGYITYARGLTGGGITVFYFSIYAAFDFYGLISFATAFSLMIAVTVIAVALSVFQNAQAITLLGLLGGFLTPFLFSSGAEPLQLRSLFFYLLLLNTGILAVIYFKKWFYLGLAAFIPVNVIFLSISIQKLTGELPPIDLTILGYQTFLTAFFILFTFFILLKLLFDEPWFRKEDSVLLALNGIIYFILSWFNLESDYAGYMGIFAFILGFVFLLLGLNLRKYYFDKSRITFVCYSLMILFWAIFFPVQFGGDQYHLTIMGWTVLTVVLCYFAAKMDDVNIRGGFWIFAAFTLANLVFKGWAMKDTYLLLGRAGLLTIFFIGALILCIYFYYRFYDNVFEKKQEVMVLGSVVCLLFLIVASMDIYRYGTLISPAATDAAIGGQNMGMLLMSVFWALYASVLMIAGFIKNLLVLRYLAMGLFGFTILKVFLIDLSYLDITYRIISLIALGVVLLGISFLYQKKS